MANFQPYESYIRVAAARIGTKHKDPLGNAKRIMRSYILASSEGASLAVFPELSLSGAISPGMGAANDEIFSETQRALLLLAEATSEINCALVVGLAYRHLDRLYNAAAFLSDGKVKGIVPSAYEVERSCAFSEYMEPACQTDKGFFFGRELLFSIKGALCGIEVGNSLLSASPESAALSKMGAVIIANPCTVPAVVGMQERWKNSVCLHSGRTISAYISSSGLEESTDASLLPSGYSIIAENAEMLSENAAFSSEQIIYADIDIKRLDTARLKCSYSSEPGSIRISTSVAPMQTGLARHISTHPYLAQHGQPNPEDALKMASLIQAHGLAGKFELKGAEKMLVSLNSAEGSALALIAACEASDILGKYRKDAVLAVNALGSDLASDSYLSVKNLADALGCSTHHADVSLLAQAGVEAIGNDSAAEYANALAWAEEYAINCIAREHSAIIVGTEDLSDSAIGKRGIKCHYSVNCSLPKSVVRMLLGLHAKMHPISAVRESIEAIMAFGHENADEPEIGYLRDFILHCFASCGDSPEKIAFLAEHAFGQTYSAEEIAESIEELISKSAAKNANSNGNGPTAFLFGAGA
ncbi:MAG: hypothetical protein FWG30_02050 [Eubacteriaceae bacterium]|nr:hypothetical protein [Eubacteriaceae bacterium]